MVCMDGRVDEANQIMYCDGCNAALHQACYGVHEVRRRGATSRAGEWGSTRHESLVQRIRPVEMLSSQYHLGFKLQWSSSNGRRAGPCDPLPKLRRACPSAHRCPAATSTATVAWRTRRTGTPSQPAGTSDVPSATSTTGMYKTSRPFPPSGPLPSFPKPLPPPCLSSHLAAGSRPRPTAAGCTCSAPSWRHRR